MFYLGRMGRSLPSPSAEGLRDTLARMYYPSSGMGLTHGPQLEERLRSWGGGGGPRAGQEKEKKIFSGWEKIIQNKDFFIVLI